MRNGKTQEMRDRTAPAHWLKITTIDAHTEGEPFRVVTSGFPELSGENILVRRRFAKKLGPLAEGPDVGTARSR